MAFERDQLGRIEPHELPMINNRLQDNQSLGKEKGQYLTILAFSVWLRLLGSNQRPND